MIVQYQSMFTLQETLGVVTFFFHFNGSDLQGAFKKYQGCLFKLDIRVIDSVILRIYLINRSCTLMTLKRVPCPIPSLSLKNEWSGNVLAISRLIIRSQAELLCK